MERYKCSLSHFLLNKAVSELNEPSDNPARLAAIDSLRVTFKRENPNVTLIKENDGFLLKFLRARKFQETKTLELLKNYHIQTSQWPQVFQKARKAKEMDLALTSGAVGPLDGKAKNGSVVVLTRYGKGQSSLLDGIALSYLTLDLLSDKEETQINGVTLIHDLAYATPRLIWQFDCRVIRRWLKLLNNGIPITLKNVIYVHQPFNFGSVFNVIYGMIDTTEKEKIVIVGKSYWRLYEYVDQSYLPPAFQGQGPQIDEEGWKTEILKRIDSNNADLTGIYSANTMCRLLGTPSISAR